MMSILSAALPWVIVLWSVFRVRYMTKDTPLIDKLSVSALGGGALGFALAPIYGGNWEEWKEVLLWGGVIGWCVTPSIRMWRGHRLGGS